MPTLAGFMENLINEFSLYLIFEKVLEKMFGFLLKKMRTTKATNYDLSPFKKEHEYLLGTIS